MHRFLRTLLAAAAGLVLGAATNMGLVLLGARLAPPPDGMDPTSVESVSANIHLFGPRHFVFPFLAHAIGTFIGALAAGLLEKPRGTRAHRFVGGFFLAGGVAMAVKVPAPTWFIATDLALAYVPTAILAARLARGFGRETPGRASP